LILTNEVNRGKEKWDGQGKAKNCQQFRGQVGFKSLVKLKLEIYRKKREAGLKAASRGIYQPVFLGAGLLVDGVDFEGCFAGLLVFLSMVTSLRFI